MYELLNDQRESLVAYKESLKDCIATIDSLLGKNEIYSEEEFFKFFLRSVNRSFYDFSDVLTYCNIEREDIVASGDEPIFYAEYVDGIYHIVMKTLLQKRVSPSVDYRSVYRETSSMLSMQYKYALLRSKRHLPVDENNNFIQFDTPIMVLFEHHYKTTDKRILDYDNFEPKIFIDSVINGVFIPDDNPKYLSHMSTTFIGDNTTHTEVYFGDLAKVLKKLNEEEIA